MAGGVRDVVRVAHAAEDEPMPARNPAELHALFQDAFNLAMLTRWSRCTNPTPSS